MTMLSYAILLAASLAAQAEVEPAHRANEVFALVLEQGLKAGGKTALLPRPSLRDGQEAERQRTALRQVAGSERALEEMFRDSVTAPYIIKVHDLKTAGATIRAADVWFVVYADLGEVDPAQEATRSDGKEVEAANMWFQARILKAADLRAAGITPPSAVTGQSTWYAHLHVQLLDRIDFEVTNRVVATQSSESIVIASQTDPAFAGGGRNSNGWKHLSHQGAAARTGDSVNAYPGGINYTKISRVAFSARALLVEIHMAFVEPSEWFDGAPILRSKFSIIAQEQIRGLRRELARKRSGKNSTAPR